MMPLRSREVQGFGLALPLIVDTTSSSFGIGITLTTRDASVSASYPDPGKLHYAYFAEESLLGDLI